MMEYLSPRLQPNSPQLTELLSRIGQSWRQSGELHPLLATAVTELCSFLKTDCVQICQLQSEARSQVLVEFRQEQRSPSGLSLPQLGTALSFAIDTLLRSTSTSCIIDVTMQRIRQKIEGDAESDLKVKPLHNSALPLIQAEALAEMGVRSVLLVPLETQTGCWGMMVVYYSFSRTFLEADLETVQLVAEQLSMVLSHRDRSPQSDSKSQPTRVLQQITRQLHLLDPLDLESPLAATVAAFQGIGGRLYLLPIDEPSAAVQLLTNGVQPATSAFTKYAAIEQYQVWQNHFNAQDDLVWAISDLAQEPELQPLESVFQPTAIRSLLMVPLWYQQRQRGYLTIFRSEHQPWTTAEIEMAHELGIHFVAAIQRSQGQTQLNTLATNLEQQVQQRTAALQQLVDRQQVLLRVTVKIRQSLNLDQIFRATTQELCRVVQAERVAVYRFNADWGGEFVNDFEFAASEWNGLSKLGVDLVWNDTYLQETQGGRYRFKETFVVEDVYAANLAPCHLESLEQYQIRSHAIAPIFVGTQLWGLLAMYQHSGPRAWADADVQFLNHVSEQLGIAIQQANLLHQTHEQTQQLQKLADYQQMMLRVLTKIRQSLDIDTIFRTTTKELAQAVQAERVAVYRFNADWSGEFVNDFEFATSEWNGLNKFGVDLVWNDTYLQETQGGRYRHKETFVVDDLEAIELSPCHLEILQQFQIRAYVIAPIFVGKQLWGLLALYQHSSPRHWAAEHIQFLNQVSEQMGIALQQARLAEHVLSPV